MTYVPTNIFKNFAGMVQVSIINYPSITLVTDAFNYCDNLEKIILNANNISEVPAAFARNCVKVNNLMMTSNQIQTIDVNAFDGLKSLRSVDLSNNSINCLQALNLSSLSLSQGFSLSFANNHIISIDRKFFMNFFALNTANGTDLTLDLTNISCASNLTNGLINSTNFKAAESALRSCFNYFRMYGCSPIPPTTTTITTTQAKTTPTTKKMRPMKAAKRCFFL